jgi:predicted amidophosphoribosyltransferase
VNCPICGKTIEKTSCNNNHEAMIILNYGHDICPHCGGLTEFDYRFCMLCGQELNSGKELNESNICSAGS